jgi:hypothetical protein
MHYKTGNEGFKTIPGNQQVCHFIWEYLNNIHHILHHLHSVGTMVLAKKLFITVSKVIILRHECNYKGCISNNLKTAKVHNWPRCRNLSNICTFLSLVRYMHIWIKNYSTIVCPLIDLTYKGTHLIWQEEHEQAM